MSASPTASSDNKTFTVTPSSSLSNNTTYKIRVTTGVKDNGAENSLSNVYETGTGFRPQLCFLLWWENQEPSSPLQMEPHGLKEPLEHQPNFMESPSDETQ
jgi:hypothetical protein